MNLPSRYLVMGVASLALVTFILVPLLVRPTSAGPAEEPPASSRPFFDQDGFRVEMDIVPHGAEQDRLTAWENMEVRFTVREEGGERRPLSGLTPLAWLVRRKDGEPLPDRDGCKREIRSLLAGRLARVAEVNLNEYHLITLDDNNSLSIIDPQIESAKTKTLGMVSLMSVGTDFLLAPDRRHVLVTLPEVGRVAVADLNRQIARYVTMEGRPWRIDLQPDGHFAWVGQESESFVHALAMDGQEPAATIAVGPGPHTFAFREDNRFVYVASPESTRLDVIDTHELARVTSVDVGQGVVGMAYSSLSRHVYVARSDGTVVLIDAENHERSGTLRLPAGTSTLAMSPDGRFAFLLDRTRSALALVDTATQAIVHTIDTLPEPVSVDFTDVFAYVRHAGSEEVILLDLGALAQENQLVTSRIVLAQRPAPGDPRARLAPDFAPLPEGGGAMVLSSPDRAIYHFMEGMNAPMGSYRTYPWSARGLLLADRTLQEIEEGTYATDFQAPRPGSYTVPFVLPTSPQLYGCFPLELEGLPTQQKMWKSLQVGPEFRQDVFTPQTTSTLRIRLTDPSDGQPLSDLEDVVVVMLRGPLFQWRGVARPLADGLYEWSATFPEAGRYKVMIACRSRDIRLGELPTTYVVVKKEGKS